MVKKKALSTLERMAHIKQKVDRINLRYYMSWTGIFILGGWCIYMFIKLISLLEFGDVDPIVYTVAKHSAILILGIFLALKGISDPRKNTLDHSHFK